MAWVYILKIKSGKFYIGSTSDLNRRLTQHISGHTPTTKRLTVEGLVLKQEYKTLKDARAVEAKIKKLKRKDYIEKMVEDGYIKLTPP